MAEQIPTQANILGDLRAEYDTRMLRVAFYESPDYRSLIESGDRSIVVGRRGAGKSALFFKLKEHWGNAEKSKIVKIAPEDYETIGLQGVFHVFEGRINLIRAAAKLAWRYALMMEIGTSVKSHFKFSQTPGIFTLLSDLSDWSKLPGSVSSKLRHRLEPLLKTEGTLEGLVSDLAHRLQIVVLERELTASLEAVDESIYVLIDRLDEGYEPNELGIGLIDGFLHASIDINNALPKTKAFIFLRDNIFRTIAKYDVDYSRQIEGQVIRLHWDEYHLFTLICYRLKIAFNLSQESSVAVWNKCTCREITGKEGFRKCLRLTLYRPRDLLVLLNNSYYRAFQHQNAVISEEDIEASAREISENRFADLHKEYSVIFPGLERLSKAFAESTGEWNLPNLKELVESIFCAPNLSAEEAQHFAILGSAEFGIQALYSIGFVGIRDESSGRFKFCHDGNQQKLEISEKSKFLVHPCYWRALNIKNEEIALDTAEQIPPVLADIHDEYDIEVSSKTPDIRKHRIGQIIAALNLIEPGQNAANKFEDWCYQAIPIIFAGGLQNCQMKPNGNATQRRDIVARNEEGTPTWKRILSDYKARQVIFEVKNYKDLTRDDYRQMNSYLCREYGSLGFIITRSDDESPRQNLDLKWVRELFFEHNKLIVKLTANWIAKHLSKARSPLKHDAADIALGGLIDRYERTYLSH